MMQNTTVAIMTTKFLSENLLGNAAIAKGFCEFAADTDAAAWLKFAGSKGRAPDDPALALDAALELSQLVLAAVTAYLDKLAAEVEARRVLGEL